MRNKKDHSRYSTLFSYESLGVLGGILLLAQIILVLLSWLLSATRLEGVRSMLSSEGIRWFFGSFTQHVGSPLFVWLVLMLIALGALQRCGIVNIFIPKKSVKTSLTYRDRIAIRVSFVFLIIYIAIICLLVFMPHAILLSATGELFPSAFSRSLIPIIAFGFVVFAISFGLMSGKMKTLGNILESLSYGISRGAPIIIIYILAIQFYASLRFVFS